MWSDWSCSEARLRCSESQTAADMTSDAWCGGQQRQTFLAESQKGLNHVWDQVCLINRRVQSLMCSNTVLHGVPRNWLHVQKGTISTTIKCFRSDEQLDTKRCSLWDRPVGRSQTGHMTWFNLFVVYLPGRSSFQTFSSWALIFLSSNRRRPELVKNRWRYCTERRRIRTVSWFWVRPTVGGDQTEAGIKKPLGFRGGADDEVSAHPPNLRLFVDTRLSL